MSKPIKRKHYGYEVSIRVLDCESYSKNELALSKVLIMADQSQELFETQHAKALDVFASMGAQAATLQALSDILFDESDEDEREGD